MIVYNLYIPCARRLRLLAVLLFVACLLAVAPNLVLAQDASQQPEPASQIAQNSPSLPAVLKVTAADTAATDRLFRGGWDLLEARDGNSYFVLGNEYVAEQLRAQGFEVAIFEQLVAPISTNLFYGGYTTLTDGYAAMDKFVAEHPSLTKMIVYGSSWRKTRDPATGYELRAICITKMRPNDCSLSPDTDKARMLLMAGIHSREIATPELAMRWAGYLVSYYGFDADVTALLDYSELWVIPYVNPDGSEIVQSGGSSPKLHRKNANNTQGDCTDPGNLNYANHHFGVDLNRNFDSQWGNFAVGQNISIDPCLEQYIGTSVASEPETHYLSTLLGNLFRDQRGSNPMDRAPETTTGFFLTLHSFSNMVLLPWGTNEPNTANDAELRALAFRMGYYNRYMVGRTNEILYKRSGAPGGTDDYAYREYGIPSFTFEIGAKLSNSDPCSGFLPAFSCLDTFWKDNFPAFIYAAKSARQGYLTGRGPTSLFTGAGKRGPINGVTDAVVFTEMYDNLYGDAPESVGRPTPSNVMAAEFYIDTPPWAGGKPCRMEPHTPENLNRYLEARIDMANLAKGRHMVFIRGRNADGFWGPTSAAWLTIDDTINASGECMPVNILDVAPRSLQFDRNNASVAVSVINSSTYYTTKWQASATASWVKLSALSGDTPAQFNVTLDRSQLSGGVHSAAVEINNLDDSTQHVSIPVAVNLPPDKLVADHASISLDVGQDIASAVLTLGNDNEGYSLQWTAHADQPWIVLDQLSGVTPAKIMVTIGPIASSFLPGTYTGSITITRSGVTAADASSADEDVLVVPISLMLPPDELRIDTAPIHLTTYDENTNAVIEVDNANFLKPIPWSAEVEGSNIMLGAVGATTPSALRVKFVPDQLLAEGIYTASVYFASPAVPGKLVVVPLEVVVDNHEVYLPAINRNAAADLVVTHIQATPGGITVTIRNDGALPVTSPFWVDLYVNPKPPPQHVNDIWADGRSAYGAVWAVRTNILPGQSLSMALGDSMYDASLSRLPPTFELGSTIMAQVDSANVESSYGGILESHEIEPIGYYNNFATARVTESALSAAGVSAAAASMYPWPPQLPVSNRPIPTRPN